LHQSLGLGRIDKFIGEFMDAGLAGNGNGRQQKRHAELSFQLIAGDFVPDRIQDVGTRVKDNFFDTIRLDVVLGYDGQHHVHGGMRQNAARVRFDADARIHNGVRFSKASDNFFCVETPAKDTEKPPWSIQCFRVGLKSIFREHCCRNPVTGRPAHVQGFGHRAEIGAYSRMIPIISAACLALG
jgi:hypothetical protein